MSKGNSVDKVSEVIAHLDVYERDLHAMVMKIRQLRLDLFDALDNDDEV